MLAIFILVLVGQNLKNIRSSTSAHNEVTVKNCQFMKCPHAVGGAQNIVMHPMEVGMMYACLVILASHVMMHVNYDNNKVLTHYLKHRQIWAVNFCISCIAIKS